MTTNEEALWSFAVRVYADPGVAPLCLRLQDEHSLDVDVLLGLLWLAERGIALDQPQHQGMLTSLLDAAAPAQARVQQIRALRRTLGSTCSSNPRWEATYEHMKAAELAAERVELSCIEAAVHHLACDPADAEHPEHGAPELARLALRRYAERVGARSSGAILDELVALVWPAPRV